MNYLPLLLPLAVVTMVVTAQHPNAPPLQLAANYQQQDASRYWVSEKLDGVRAYWDGEALWSRAGHRFVVPDWFVADFPSTHLDGELWLGRGQFDALSAAVRRYQPQEDEWRQIRFMVFDLPQSSALFEARLSELEQLLTPIDTPYLQLIEQQRLTDNTALAKLLKDVESSGGEGLMLRHKHSRYQAGRNQGLLKLKQFQDAEAKVVAHLPGFGKYQGMLGALLVETPDGRQFRLGTGFSDVQRQTPPAVGSTVTYRYQGETQQRQPRFAYFMRERKEDP
ncbi:DNA ligase [Oceanisphaera sp. IT1-181]|uniref:DNA ligase n=1 Tax=Oceanisphaera sp. IT1-181 TaxID=3081199 RepID=UPI0029C9BCD7|nr:DNA ligase [Oceanisphaera sp. IT1-181]